MENSLNYISDFYEKLDHAKIMLVYDGILSKEIVEAFISRLKIDIEKTDVPKKEKKRFFSIVVECIQNLSKHGNVNDINYSHFLVLVEKENNTLKIYTGNVVNTKNERVIIDLINNVNEKNAAELQRLYKEGINLSSTLNYHPDFY